MSEERNQYAVVPFDTFERYLGPRYENIPGVEYILENGTLLYFMEEAPGVYESGDHTVTGAPAAPKLFVPVYEGDEMQPHAFAEVGPREQFAAITDFSVTIGLPGVNQRKEPGYVLDNGLVLMESERDSQKRGPKSLRPCGSSFAGRRRRVHCLGPVCRKGKGDQDGLAEGGTGNHHSF